MHPGSQLRLRGRGALLVAFALLLVPAGAALAAPTPVDVVFVLDNSGSMRQHDPAFLTRSAVVDFADAMASDPTLDGRIAVVLFDAKARLARPLAAIGGDDPATALRAALADLDFSGQRTHSPAGVERALYELRESGRPDARRAIVLLSDGKIDTGDPAADREAARWLREDLAQQSRSEGVRIYGIAFTELADYELMQSLALKTDARYYRAFEASELAPVVDEVLAGIQVDEPLDAVEGEGEIALAPGPGEKTPIAPAVGAGPGATSDDEGGLVFVVFVFVVLLLAGGALLWRRRRRSAPAGHESVDGAGRAGPATAPRAQLLDVAGQLGDTGAAIALRPGTTRIGRDPHNDIVLPDDTISSEHAVIEVRDGRYWVEDRRSTNGTRLGDQRLEPGHAVQLKGGDHVRFAEIDLMFVLAGYVPSGATVYANSTSAPPIHWAAEERAADREPRAEALRPAFGAHLEADGAADPPDAAAADRSVEQPDAAAPDRSTPEPVADELDLLFASASDARDGGRATGSDADDSVLASPSDADDSVAGATGGETDELAEGAAPEPSDAALSPAKGAADAEGEPGAPPARRDDPRISALPDPEARLYRDCIDYHLEQVAAISPAFASFVERAFVEELRGALAVAAREVVTEAAARDVLATREYTRDRIRFVLCGVPGSMERARDRFVAAHGGFTRLLTEQLQADSFRQSRCEILAVLTVGRSDAPWVSLSIVPEEGQDPHIDLLSYEFLTEEERREIEPSADGEASRSGLA